MEKDNKSIEEQRRERLLKQKRGEKILRILEILTQGTALTYALMLAFAPGTTYQMAKGLRRLPENIGNFFEEERKKQQFRSLLSYLQKRGLASKKIINGRIFWFITNKGQIKRNDLKSKLDKANGLPVIGYPTEKINKLVAIIFDIPEKEKFKRDWFRGVLKNLGFSLIQKSVWMGKIKVPQELIKDLKKLNILNFIKIFSVVEIGNLD